MPTAKRHRFFLNPYEEHAFTKCPRCQEKTRIRKFPLAIHIEPDQMFLLNKSCKYCPACDILIAKQSEIEPLMAASFEERRPEVVGNEYLVVGTMEKKDWTATVRGKMGQHKTVESIHRFEEILNFEMIPGGWYRDGEHPSDRLRPGEDA